MLKEGQTLWWVPAQNRNAQGREVTVVKVGRKWATISNNYRIAIDNLVADGGIYSPPGQCYPSQAAYEAELALNAAWHKFRRSLDLRAVPNGVTIDNIEAARKLLNIHD